MKKQVFNYLPLLALAFVPASMKAQSAVEAHMGLGTAFNSANGGGIDNASSANAFGSCVPGSGDSSCQATPSLSGVFMNFGGSIMFKDHFGAGAEAAITPAQSNYGPLQYRQLFFDGNGIYAPISKKKYALQILGGIGTARTSFGYSQSSCVGTAVCSTQSQAVGSATHFQVHAGVGVLVNVTDHIFIRPAFDLHYVPGFTDQFGHNATPMFSVSVGYGSTRGE